jgi:hypothetical protein
LQTKLAGAELPWQIPRFWSRIQPFDSTKSPDWAYDQGAPGGTFSYFTYYFLQASNHSTERSIVMAARTQVEKTPSEHFMKTVHDELAKFERKEIEFQKTERNQRAARLRLPIGQHYSPLSKSATD